ncbi:hypothetical protein ACEXQB_001685 [Herbiconiux sp. P18]|uniref:hypothetical protein n=1 Tax=Herbiconiux liangxiaofengii TaxID=3342795 RepID=UPI0035BA15C5
MTEDQVANVLNGIAVIVASGALVVSLIVTRLTLSQAKQLNDGDAARSQETYEKDRFEELVGRAKEILMLAADLEAFTDWRFKERSNQGDDNLKAQRAADVERSVTQLKQLTELLVYNEHLLPNLARAPQASILLFGYEKEPAKRLVEQAAWLATSADLLLRYDIDLREGRDPSVDEGVDTSEEAVDLLLMRLIENISRSVSRDYDVWKWYRAARRKEITDGGMPSVDVYELARTEFYRSLEQFRTSLGDLFAATSEARRQRTAPGHASASSWVTSKGTDHADTRAGTSTVGQLERDPFGQEALGPHLHDPYYPGAP